MAQFKPNFCLPAVAKCLYSRQEEEREDRGRYLEVRRGRERNRARGMDTMPLFYGQKQSPSALESFPFGKISPSCSGDQINVTPLPQGGCRASTFPPKLGLDFFLPLTSSWELAVKITLSRHSSNGIETDSLGILMMTGTLRIYTRLLIGDFSKSNDGIKWKRKLCTVISKLADIETDNKTSEKSIDLSEILLKCTIMLLHLWNIALRSLIDETIRQTNRMLS